jgi:serine/threonine protein kinase
MNERDIFIAALQKQDGPERRAYLDEACRTDPALCERVLGLLAVHERAGSFLERPAAAPDASGGQATEDRLARESPAPAVGPYKLLQAIGEGGMGTVYMAEQTRPVQRKVAVKIIKPGMDSKQVIARFEAERQALALMDHPNIAKVLDAGATAEGRPYFVMELVKGVPITRYCDERRLTPRQRLELFVPVCQAVQHAHQKGVIHRDLKPSNVLIALYDGRPVPKVIDFGVAKATGPKLTDRTLFTEFGAVVGTLEYMSPEQAQLNQLDVDTRSDIYSLGVLLYELLTGTTPLDRQRLKATALLEALRLIREEEPPTPSTRLSATAKLPSVAANRGAGPKKLRGLVKGELDWIVMKCLAKDRGRRYETANSLAYDLERYLKDEPVQACPPSAAYRFGKLVRRHKAGLAAVALLGVGLLAAVVVLALSTVWVADEREEAVRQRDAARVQRGRAEVNLRKAHQAVNDYFTRVSESTLLNEPALEPLRKQLLEDALRYYRDFADEYGDAPELRAELAVTYLRIGLLTHNFGSDHDWLPWFQKGIAVVEELVRSNAHAAAFRDMKTAIPWLNTSVGFHADRPAETLRTFQKARVLWEELVRVNPKVPGLRNDLALIYLVLGMLEHSWFDRPRGALPPLRKCCDLWQELSRAEPSAPH